MRSGLALQIAAGVFLLILFIAMPIGVIASILLGGGTLSALAMVVTATVMTIRFSKGRGPKPNWLQLLVLFGISVACCTAGLLLFRLGVYP